MLAAAVICAVAASLRSPAARHAIEPLFMQVHITNPLSGISSADLGLMLSGAATGFRSFGGPDAPARIFADARIADNLRKTYPDLKCKTLSFDDDPIISDRGFLGISDARGLRPCFKILSIDGTLPWGRVHDDGNLEKDGAPYPFIMAGAEKWDPNAHSTIVQTGVTAMTRAFIAAVDRSGDILSPVRYTMKITTPADLATTSNEVSFLEPCTYPLKNPMVFCSPVRFFKILSESGFDVIELTGNHNNDFSSRYNMESIGMLERAGMRYFGGGRNKQDAEQVRYIAVKDATVAFIGFNEPGPETAFAAENRAGAARLSLETFVRSIREAAGKADIIIVTVQWGNEDGPIPREIQTRYFHLAADLGATIMVSSSAHRPMGLEFYRGRFISYGLGNFLFDQMQSLNHRRGLIARHHLYRGRHVATELIPYCIHDWSQPRISTGRDARAIMEEVFRRSIGPVFRRP